ncbi:uroporphyrinogen-III C-methyltransferase [Nakamurella endophytica]|uniref:Uroporphyrinogen-III C-methyltransferase n=1 Tax=Nakamurella endophytica TaxID=1748367 RepID=A0A917SQ49_9ACTN|nr:uroporphyrinogen-III C-methyltransferase [Nakamurella endophytica]
MRDDTRGSGSGHPDLLPLHLLLVGRPVTAVGGGPAAARKVTALLDAGAEVLVVAPELCEDLTDLHDTGEIRWIAAEFTADLLDGAWLAVTATGSPDVDAAVSVAAEERRIFCIRADSGTAGSARMPAVLRRDDLLIGVSSRGAPDPRRVAVARSALATALDTGRIPMRRHRPGPGRVVLVGGGPGEPGLLTVRGRQELAAADVVVVDRLAPREVLADLDPAVRVIEVGKAPGMHPVPQHRINEMLVQEARSGARVVRLKGGDPFVFGRGAEEVAACREAGIDVTVVPGVSSALAVPALAGIAVTTRGLSREVTVVSGHELPVAGDPRWTAWAGTATLVVLMGVGTLGNLARGLRSAGAAPDRPVAVIERGGLPGQRVLRGTLADIAEGVDTAAMRAPSVIVVGDVAALTAGDPSLCGHRNPRETDR